jgi:O-antigen ligase
LTLSTAIIFLALGRSMTPSAWLSVVHSPMLVGTNDIVCFAVLAPLSLALLASPENRLDPFLAALSILSSAYAVALAQSRGATVTFVLSVLSFAALARQRLGLIAAAVVILTMTFADAHAGFLLRTKFTQKTDTRLAIWVAAWKMFLARPWLGHGPHTFGILYRDYLDVPTCRLGCLWPEHVRHGLIVSILSSWPNEA